MVPLAGVYCVPKIGHAWDMSLMASCGKLAIVAPLQGAVGLATDLFILILPAPILWGLNLPPRKKLGVTLVFLAGTFAVIASTVSLYYRIRTWLGHDPTWNGSIITITTFVEGFVTVIVSCAPAISCFWLNIVTKSSIYNSIVSPRGSMANSEKVSDSDDNSEFSKNNRSRSSKPSLYGSANYEHTDAFYGKLTTMTEVRAVPVERTSKEGFIIKETSVDQSSERSFRSD
ncbi:hypothetical protein M7I_7892 [Glarea lozoyensis 74030]|nr:hypothetical protein M7I_7892 [Glarea lozoyensis 74030]